MINKTAYNGQFKKRKVFICCYLEELRRFLIFLHPGKSKHFITSQNYQKVFHHAAKEMLENKKQTGK